MLEAQCDCGTGTGPDAHCKHMQCILFALDGVIWLAYVPTNLIVADVITKLLSRIELRIFVCLVCFSILFCKCAEGK